MTEKEIKMGLLFDYAEQEPRKFVKFSIGYKPYFEFNGLHIHGVLESHYEEPKDYLMENAAVIVFIKDNLDSETIIRALDIVRDNIERKLNLTKVKDNSAEDIYSIPPADIPDCIYGS
ncbi:MAG TPA: hypothetical protein VGB02_12335 [Pyrinomonadaceae bacterium]|jgi:hypothetical protein